MVPKWFQRGRRADCRSREDCEGPQSLYRCAPSRRSQDRGAWQAQGPEVIVVDVNIIHYCWVPGQNTGVAQGVRAKDQPRRHPALPRTALAEPHFTAKWRILPARGDPQEHHRPARYARLRVLEPGPQVIGKYCQNPCKTKDWHRFPTRLLPSPFAKPAGRRPVFSSCCCGLPTGRSSAARH